MAKRKRTPGCKWAVAKRLCQDEVILITDNAGKKATYSASCPRRSSC